MNHFYIWWVSREMNYAHSIDYSYNDQDKDANMTFSTQEVETGNSWEVPYMEFVRKL
jgi:hypothetical protein